MIELTVLLTTLSITTIRLRFIFYHCTESSRILKDQDDGAPLGASLKSASFSKTQKKK